MWHDPITEDLRRPDPLPSWNEGPAKSAILDFVARVTRPGGPDFVPPEDRLATFDNDGTLWTEQPCYVQACFALDRARVLAGEHPDWQQRQPWKAVLEDGLAALAGIGERGLVEIVTATHMNNSAEQFHDIVEKWISSSRHPRFQRLYTQLIYQPMLELLLHLRGSAFKTIIVTGGGVEFVRVFSQRVYGIPPDQVIGSRCKLRYESREGKPALFRLPEVDLIDDGPGKPVGIQELLGRRPIAAFGNSDGDFEMLDWTTSGPERRLGVIVHHTDSDREWAYDRDARVGRLSRALDEAPGRGWLTVDMKRDWRVVYPFQATVPGDR
jgi:phosphoglycolate phosphatase-like HAD superfamily hydrolase